MAGVQDVQGERDRGRDPQYVTPNDRSGVAVPRTQPDVGDGYHVQEHPHDDGGDDKGHFSDAEVDCSVDYEDKYCVAEVEFIDVADISKKRENDETHR